MKISSSNAILLIWLLIPGSCLFPLLKHNLKLSRWNLSCFEPGNSFQERKKQIREEDREKDSFGEKKVRGAIFLRNSLNYVSLLIRKKNKSCLHKFNAQKERKTSSRKVFLTSFPARRGGGEFVSLVRLKLEIKQRSTGSTTTHIKALNLSVAQPQVLSGTFAYFLPPGTPQWLSQISKPIKTTLIIWIIYPRPWHCYRTLPLGPTSPNPPWMSLMSLHKKPPFRRNYQLNVS